MIFLTKYLKSIYKQNLVFDETKFLDYINGVLKLICITIYFHDYKN